MPADSWWLFTQQEDICDSCLKRRQQATVWSALGNVEERELTTAEMECDLRAYLAEHENDIKQRLRQAINVCRQFIVNISVINSNQVIFWMLVM